MADKKKKSLVEVLSRGGTDYPTGTTVTYDDFGPVISPPGKAPPAPRFASPQPAPPADPAREQVLQQAEMLSRVRRDRELESQMRATSLETEEASRRRMLQALEQERLKKRDRKAAVTDRLRALGLDTVYNPYKE